MVGDEIGFPSENIFFVESQKFAHSLMNAPQLQSLHFPIRNVQEDAAPAKVVAHSVHVLFPAEHQAAQSRRVDSLFVLYNYIVGLIIRVAVTSFHTLSRDSNRRERECKMERPQIAFRSLMISYLRANQTYSYPIIKKL